MPTASGGGWRKMCIRDRVYIDGKEGTTGLQIYDWLAQRQDIDLLLIDEEKRKDTQERKKLMNAADAVSYTHLRRCRSGRRKIEI